MMWLSLALAGNTHPVSEGDTLAAIAKANQVSEAAIRKLNDLKAGVQPVPGTLLKLPDPDTDHGEQRAFLVALRGDATFEGPAGKRDAVLFEPVDAGTEICTGAKGRATVRLASTCNAVGDQSDDLVLAEETCVIVESAFSGTSGRSSVVRLVSGTVAVQHLPEAQGHVTLKTRDGITTGAGGGYRVTVEEAASRTEALSGPVAVQAQGASVGLAAGQGSRVKTGEAPGAAVDLLRPKELWTPGANAPLLRPLFDWEPVDEAFAYRLEIARDDAFIDVVFADEVDDAPLKADLLLLPTQGAKTLYWRVASYDRLGFLGIPTEARAFTLPW